MAFDRATGRRYLGTENAALAVDFHPGAPRLLGPICVGWFSGAIAFDEGRRVIDVANVTGRGSGNRIRPE